MDTVLAGLADDQERWARDSLEGVVAPAWGDAFPAVSDYLSSLTPDERWDALVFAHYLALLEPMREMAHELAASDPPPYGIDWREVEAGVLLGTLDALADEMSESVPNVLDLLAPEVNDAMEACRSCLPSGRYA